MKTFSTFESDTIIYLSCVTSVALMTQNLQVFVHEEWLQSAAGAVSTDYFSEFYVPECHPYVTRVL